MLIMTFYLKIMMKINEMNGIMIFSIMIIITSAINNMKIMGHHSIRKIRIYWIQYFNYKNLIAHKIKIFKQIKLNRIWLQSFQRKILKIIKL